MDVRSQCIVCHMRVPNNARPKSKPSKVNKRKNTKTICVSFVCIILFMCLFSVCLFVCLFACLLACLCFCLFVCLFVCFFVSEGFQMSSSFCDSGFPTSDSGSRFEVQEVIQDLVVGSKKLNGYKSHSSPKKTELSCEVQKAECTILPFKSKTRASRFFLIFQFPS